MAKQQQPVSSACSSLVEHRRIKNRIAAELRNCLRRSFFNALMRANRRGTKAPDRRSKGGLSASGSRPLMERRCSRETERNGTA